jgi:transposase
MTAFLPAGHKDELRRRETDLGLEFSMHPIGETGKDGKKRFAAVSKSVSCRSATDLSFSVTPATVRTTFGARCLLAGRNYCVPRLTKIWADQASQGPALADWCRATGGWELEVVKRTSGAHRWSQHPKRWIVERTCAWLRRNRRLAMDYERNVQMSETLIEVAMIRLLVARGGSGT